MGQSQDNHLLIGSSPTSHDFLVENKVDQKGAASNEPFGIYEFSLRRNCLSEKEVFAGPHDQLGKLLQMKSNPEPARFTGVFELIKSIGHRNADPSSREKATGQVEARLTVQPSGNWSNGTDVSRYENQRHDFQSWFGNCRQNLGIEAPSCQTQHE